ncbi:MAG: KH domain-containing protein [Candidatus Levybacteria bacterium]|nr:KH domain-containing protein [Candidatus Levybacteria bacterium]
MKDTLSYIISSIIDDPKGIIIDEKENDGIIEFAVTVPKAELGKVIGKKGRIIASIRNVMKIKALRQNKRVIILLQEPQQDSAQAST